MKLTPATRATAILVLLAASLALAACETVKGAGKDIQNAGEAGERAIDRATR